MPLKSSLNNDAGLKISHYNSSDGVYPILPLLSEEFPNWTIDKIKNYVKLVDSKKSDVAGILVAQNEAKYNVGMLIYSFQSISSKYLQTNEKKEFTYGLIVENIVSLSPILRQQIYFVIIEYVINLAKKNNCKFIELPRFDESYNLIKKKYQFQISNPNSFRVFIKLD